MIIYVVSSKKRQYKGENRNGQWIPVMAFKTQPKAIKYMEKKQQEQEQEKRYLYQISPVLLAME